MPLSFVVPPEQAGWTVRDFLRACGVSSTAVRRAKRTGAGILADGRPVHTDVRLSAGSRVLLPDVPESSDLVPEDIPLEIVFEDENAVVLEKPAGMAVHPTLGYAGGTLANAWMGELARRGRTGGFHPVYRLDRDTSGLLLLAGNAAAEPFLERSCRKLYAALVQGHLPKPEGTVETPIALKPGSIILRCTDPAGAPARTHYRVLMRNENFSLVVFRLETGRTHQIRVHMASLGCPLAGDELYGGSRQLIARQALHCAALSFRLPDGRPICCSSPFPAGLTAAAGLEPVLAQRLISEAESAF